ncbi:MAG: glycosyltransferase family 2 protein [DPANN group archaeon]|nr:glycosyltransferase family 2 protein [DPANN group archaeon]
MLTITDCLNSLVNQTYKNIELILVDDSSTDKSTFIARDFERRYDFIKYFRIEHRDELQEWPRIQGAKQATGEILFMAEADAKYAQDYVELCAKHLKNKQVGGVVGHLNVWEPKTFISKYKALTINPRFADIEKLIYEPNAKWWHRWRENIGETIESYFHFGRKMYALNKNDKQLIMKNLYFLAPFALVILSMFSMYFLLILFLHFIVLEKAGLELYKKSKGNEFRNYALLSPAVSYLQNIPFAVGFFYSRLIYRQ